MKNGMFIVIGFMLILIAGCVQQPTDPFIKDVQPDKNFATDGSKVQILYTVENPTKINFVGTIFLQADVPKCFGIYESYNQPTGISKSISVEAGREASSVFDISIPERLEASCYTRHKINIFLLQNTTTLSAKTIEFPLVQR